MYKRQPKGTSNYKDTWGSKEDYAAMQEDFDAVNDAFIKKGYGVIFGEFGVVSVNKDGIPAYFEQFFKSCKQYGMLPVMWDEGTYVDRSGTANLRKNAYFVYSDIGEVISKITGAVPKLSADAQKLLTLTGIPESPVTENQNPLVVATWDGDFMRNTTTSDSVDLKGIGQMFGQEFLGQYNNLSLIHIYHFTLFLCIVSSVAAACLVYTGMLRVAEEIFNISLQHQAGYICSMLFIIPGFQMCIRDRL